jgi:DNA-binding NarL/FixJ family response regulator
MIHLIKNSLLVIKRDMLSSTTICEQFNNLGYSGHFCQCTKEGLLNTLKTLHPEFMIIDLDDCKGQATEILRIVKKLTPSTKCVAIIPTNNKNLINVLLEDVSGYLTDNSTFEDIEFCFSILREGKKYVAEDIRKVILSFDLSHSEQANVWNNLTKREKEIIQLIALGHGNKKIADILFRSTKTVAAIKYNLTKKLELDGSQDLTSFATLMCN